MANKVETVFSLKDLQSYLQGLAAARKANEALMARPALTARTPVDTELKKAEADIKRYNAERLKFEKDLTRQIEKESKTRADIQIKEVKRANQEAIRELKARNNANESYSTEALGSLPGGGILSALAVGGAAGASLAIFTEAINLTKQLTVSMVNLGVEAVQTGAEFERTVKGLAVFAGGANNAEKEIGRLHKTISAAPGLLLNDAEQGYNRLRALGFAAQTSADLIKGLAVAGQQVGATSQDINRVVTNLIQLSGGSSRASADIKELVHALPNLRNVLKDAFGTVEGSELGKIFQNDPTASIEKFAASLAKLQAAQPGLSGALTALENVITLAEREFSKPILAPLTTSIIGLTSYINTNKETWASWGKVVAEAVSGADAAIRNTKYLAGLLTTGVLPQITGTSLTTGVLPQLSGGPNASGLEGPLPLLGRLSNRSKLTQVVPAVEREPIPTGGIKENKVLLDSFKDSNQAQIQDSERKYKILETQQKAYLTKNKTEELAQVKSLGAIHEQSIQDQIAITRQGLDRILNNTKISESQKREAVKESSEEFAKLYNELTLTQINNAADIAKKEKELFEERKKQADEYKKKILEVRETIFSSLAISSANPYVKIFSEAQSAIERTKEQVKGLNSQIQRAALGSAQRANAATLFNQRIDTQLEADALRSQAAAINRAAQPITMKFSDLAIRDGAGNFIRQSGTNIVGDLETRIAYKQRELAKRLNPNLSDSQVDEQIKLRSQINSILGTNRQGIDKDLVASITQSRLASVLQNIDPSIVPNDLRKFASDTLNAQAEAKAKQEAQAAKLYNRLDEMLKEGGKGIPVDFGNQAPFQIDLIGAGYQMRGVAAPNRATPNDTAKQIKR